MTTIHIIPIIFTIFAVLLLVHGISADIRSDREQYTEKENKSQLQQQENELWLQQELEKPRYRVCFCIQNEYMKYTDVFEPYIDFFGIKCASERNAKNYIDMIIPLGYIQDSDGTIYQISSVSSMRVEKE